ncbi:uncharacterized protein LOC128220356 [Mya arenaria]|uniref:uncharacterized protein LOC128220356 n=1 Tax=Mya arenaria TaxID=6604 RepID=UPI0022DFA124|nr:uncharacterized protein LOC128220356 [Mya arenaria]
MGIKRHVIYSVAIYVVGNVKQTFKLHKSARVRQRALKEMCPCHVKEDLTEFWDRVLDMVGDESPVVRYQVLHTLCDGSPTHMEDKVADVLDIFNNDSDPKLRRKAHQVLSGYRRTGKWNVM